MVIFFVKELEVLFQSSSVLHSLVLLLYFKSETLGHTEAPDKGKTQYSESFANADKQSSDNKESVKTNA